MELSKQTQSLLDSVKSVKASDDQQAPTGKMIEKLHEILAGLDSRIAGNMPDAQMDSDGEIGLYWDRNHNDQGNMVFTPNGGVQCIFTRIDFENPSNNVSKAVPTKTNADIVKFYDDYCV